MRILVTGGYGFIGSNFIQNYINHPDIELIVNIDKLSMFSNSKNVSRNSKLRNFTFDVGSENILNLLSNYQITHVLHLADNTANTHNTIQTNVNNIVNFLNNCVKYGSLKRFHSLLSLSYDEFYSASKSSCIHILQSYFNEFKLPVTNNVCGQVYGPRQHSKKLVPSFIQSIKTNSNIIAKPYTHNWVYVDDVCSAIFDTISVNDSLNGLREIKSEYEFTEYEIACKLKALMQSDTHVECDVVPPKYHPFSNSFSQIFTKTDINVGLQQTIDHLV